MLVDVTALDMILGILSELTFDYLIMIDSMSLWLKESSGLFHYCLFTSSHHVGRRVILVLFLVIRPQQVDYIVDGIAVPTKLHFPKN